MLYSKFVLYFSLGLFASVSVSALAFCFGFCSFLSAVGVLEWFICSSFHYASWVFCLRAEDEQSSDKNQRQTHGEFVGIVKSCIEIIHKKPQISQISRFSEFQTQNYHLLLVWAQMLYVFLTPIHLLCCWAD